jgi:hypothetical protein
MDRYEQKRPRCTDVWTELEETAGRPAHAVIRASAPVRDAGRPDERRTNHEDDGAGDQGRKEPLEEAWWHEGHEYFQEGSDEGCA